MEGVPTTKTAGRIADRKRHDGGDSDHAKPRVSISVEGRRAETAGIPV